MNNQQALQIANYIYKDIFGEENKLSFSELQSKFAIDIPTVQKITCALSQTDTWAFASIGDKIASQDAVEKQFQKDEWLKQKKKLTTIDDILQAWKEVNYIMSEKYVNSKDVAESDSIFTSASVFRSVSVTDSKNIISSYKIFDCNYMFASRDSQSCTLGIRVKESIFCSSSFEISWSNKVSKSMFIHDSYDLYECLFCSHIRSRKYCIANMQFEKDEYFALKKQVISWILD